MGLDQANLSIHSEAFTYGFPQEQILFAGSASDARSITEGFSLGMNGELLPILLGKALDVFFQVAVIVP